MRRLTRWVGTLGLLGLLAMTACDSPKEKEAKYVEHGKSLYDGGDYVKAALEFKNALQIDPAAVEPQYYLALIAEKQHDVAGAAAAFARAADEDPHHFEANLKAGQYALLGNDPQTAQRYARVLIANAPTKPDGHTLMAAAFLMQNKLPEAEKEANAALAIDPQNTDALAVLAGRDIRDLDTPGALAIVDRGLSTNPNSIELLTLKLKLMFDEKRTPDVIAVLRKLHAVDPANSNYIIDLGNQLAATNQTDEARDLLRQSLDKNPDSEPLIAAYVNFLITNKSLDEAIDQLKALANQPQQSSQYTFVLEELYLKAGKLDLAASLMTDLQSNGKTAGSRLQAQVELARIAVLKGDKQGALTQLGTVLGQDPDNDAAYLLRAAIMLGDSKYDSAISDARNVLNHNINSIPALTILSKAYAATGDTDLAIETLRNLVQLEPTDVNVRLQLASLLAPKSSDEAMQNLDAAMTLDPQATELKVQKADYLIRIGESDKADLIGQDLTKDSKFAATGHRILGEVALQRSDFATAISELNQAQSLGEPFDKVGPTLVTAYVKSGKAGDADKMLSDRIAKDGTDTKAMILLASMRADDGKRDQAESLLRRAITARPNDSDAYLALTQLLAMGGKNPEAVQVSRDAASKFLDNHAVQVAYAVASDTAGDFDAAHAQYEKVLAKWPDDMIAANNLAALIADVWPDNSTLLDRARSLAEKFRNSSDPILLDTLGWVLLRQKNYDDAAIQLERASSLAPDNQQLQFHYALALKAKGLTEKAKSFFAKALAGNPSYRGLDEAKRQASTL